MWRGIPSGTSAYHVKMSQTKMLHGKMLRVSMLSLSKRCHSQNVVSVCTVKPPLQFIRVHTKNLCRPNNDSLRPWTAIPHLSLDTDLVSAALQ